MAGFQSLAGNEKLMHLKEKLELEEDEKASKAKGQEQDVKSQERDVECKNANEAISVLRKEKILLTFLSTYNAGATAAKYHADGNVELEGVQTNDAPVQYLMSLPEQKITKIFCIVSHKVHKDIIQINGGSTTRFEYFKKQIEEYSTNFQSPVDEMPEIVEIKYDFYDDGNMVEGDKTSYVLEQLSSEFAKCADADVYIDYTGGLRDMNFFMTILVRLLEFQGKRCAKIVYADWENKQIVGLEDTYNLLQLINGMGMFMATGNPMLLQELVRKIPPEIAKDKINALCNALVEFSDNVSICAVSDIQTKWVAIKDALHDVANYKATDVYHLLFQSFVTTMKDKMGLSDVVIYAVLEIVAWCTNNRLFQQALTIFNDHILPLYYQHNEYFKDVYSRWVSNEQMTDQNRSLNSEKAKKLVDLMESGAPNNALPQDINKAKIKEFLRVFRTEIERTNEGSRVYVFDLENLKKHPRYREFRSVITLFDSLCKNFEDVRVSGDTNSFEEFVRKMYTSGCTNQIARDSVCLDCVSMLYRCSSDDNVRNYGLLRDIAHSLVEIVKMRNSINHANASNQKIGDIVGGLNRAIGLSRVFLK